jgi:beta-phosphoglucomutase
MKQINNFDELDKIVQAQIEAGKRCFLFDMDGTLVDTELNHFHAIKDLVPQGKPDHVSIGFEDIVGRPDKQVFENFGGFQYFQRSWPDWKLAKDRALIADLKANNLSEKNNLIDPKLLNILVNIREKNCSLGLVSASSRDVINAIIKLFPAELFEVSVGEGEAAKDKPNPEPYLSAMKLLKSSPENTIIFEDSETGMEAGIKSGSVVFQANWFSQS